MILLMKLHTDRQLGNNMVGDGLSVSCRQNLCVPAFHLSKVGFHNKELTGTRTGLTIRRTQQEIDMYEYRKYSKYFTAASKYFSAVGQCINVISLVSVQNFIHLAISCVSIIQYAHNNTTIGYVFNINHMVCNIHSVRHPV